MRARSDADGLPTLLFRELPLRLPAGFVMREVRDRDERRRLLGAKGPQVSWLVQQDERVGVFE